MENQIRENQILEDQAMAMEAKTTAHKLLVADIYRKSGRTLDLTLKCKGKEFKVHKLLAATLSGLLEEECFYTDADSFDCEDDSPDEIERLINYFYTGCYLKAADLDSPLEARLHLHIKMMAMGRKYVCGILSQAAVDFFVEDMPNCEKCEYLEHLSRVRDHEMASDLFHRMAIAAANSRFESRSVREAVKVAYQANEDFAKEFEYHLDKSDNCSRCIIHFMTGCNQG